MKDWRNADQLLQDFYSKKYHLPPAKEEVGMSYMPENLKMTSSEGIRVRSKSELLIIECLQSHHLVFSYERPLKLDGHKNFLPDFTLYEPLTVKMIYWEHFGLMNHVDYKLSAENKLLQYAENNIVEGKNLIVTYDNTDGSIDMQQIETMIQKYFFLASYRLNLDFVPTS